MVHGGGPATVFDLIFRIYRRAGGEGAGRERARGGQGIAVCEEAGAVVSRLTEAVFAAVILYFMCLIIEITGILTRYFERSSIDIFEGEKGDLIVLLILKGRVILIEQYSDTMMRIYE